MKYLSLILLCFNFNLISAQSTKRHSLDSAFYSVNDSSFYYDFDRLNFDPYLKMGVGFVVIDSDTNNGLLTGNFEGGIKVNYYFKKFDDEGYIFRKNISLYSGIGWGPLLVADNLVPNYWNLEAGVSLEYLGASSYFGFTTLFNSSDEGIDNLYGLTLGVEQIQTPFFFTLLIGEEVNRIVMAGIKIPVFYILPVKKNIY